MSFLVAGTNHRRSPLELREKVSFSGKRRDELLGILKQSEALTGSVVLSTCNRTEIYARAGSVKEAAEDIIGYVARLSGVEKSFLRESFYLYGGKKALRHLFSVASGLDSQIVGETQILGQVRDAFEAAREAGSAGGLEMIFRSAVSAAAVVRKNTGISSGKTSLGSVAVDFIKYRLGSLGGRKILIIGVGKVSGLVAKYLEDENPEVVFIANRTYRKARELAGKTGAVAVGFDSLMEHLAGADAVISATGSPHLILKKDVLAGLNGNLLIIDLAVPRDVEPSAGELENISLYSLEDLDALIRKNVRKKSEEAERAGKIIGARAEKLWENIYASEPGKALSR